jgi:glycosyltransferase involved in cell wall biosynthesis
MSKIAFIDLLFNWPPDGGARVDLKEIMSRLSQRHDVTLLVPDFQDFFPRGRITGEFPFRVVKLPFTKSTFNAWSLPRAFAREVDRIRPDRLFIGDGWYLKFPLAAALRRHRPILRFYAYEGLCITHYGTLFRDGRACPKNYLSDTAFCVRCALHRHRFRPLDAFSHEFLAALAFTPLYRRWVGAALAGASRVIVYNRFMKEILAPRAREVLVVPSGVDTAAFAAAERPAPPRGRCVAMMTGRSGDPSKGFGVLLEAARILAARGVKLDIVVPTYSSGHAADAQVRFIPWQPQERLPLLYSEADICVVPSVWREPFGIAAVEAMAAGRPVVASRSGGLEGIVEDGVTGFLVEPGNAAELAGRLAQLAADPDLRGRMGRAGREKAGREYSWDALMRDIYLPLFD